VEMVHLSFLVPFPMEEVFGQTGHLAELVRRNLTVSTGNYDHNLGCSSLYIW